MMQQTKNSKCLSMESRALKGDRAVQYQVVEPSGSRAAAPTLPPVTVTVTVTVDLF